MFKHPLWLVGFRPFFILAMLSGAFLPMIWIAVFAGYSPLPGTGLQAVQWHAHEMLFGFGWAVLGGFLLTASKNWVKIRGLHGGPLAAVALFWILERFAVALVPADAPEWFRLLALNIFLLSVTAYVLWTLIKYRKQDTFHDNWFFVIALPMFLIAKNLMLSPTYFVAGWTMAIGLFRVAFCVMFERTMPQFMKNKMGILLPRNPAIDLSIKVLILFGAFESFLPVPFAAGILVAAAALLLWRWFTWSPLRGMSDFGIALMYIGYLGLTTHLILEATRITGLYAGVGALSVHVFTFLCMGVVIPGMLIRISQGHTGRKLLFTTSDRFALGAMFLGAGFRLIATQVSPAYYTRAIAAAGIGWSLCFVLLAVRLIPFLWQARIDGREH
jgi:uncharacterized protein involved in response to NO